MNSFKKVSKKYFQHAIQKIVVEQIFQVCPKVSKCTQTGPVKATKSLVKCAQRPKSGNPKP